MIFIALTICFILGVVLLLIIISCHTGFFPLHKMKDKDIDNCYNDPRKNDFKKRNEE